MASLRAFREDALTVLFTPPGQVHTALAIMLRKVRAQAAEAQHPGRPGEGGRDDVARLLRDAEVPLAMPLSSTRFTQVYV